MRIDFLIEITRRRLIERYIGTSSRLIWVLLAPVVPLLMNLVVFYWIAKIPEVQEMGLANYAVFIFTGLLPFRYVQKACTDSCDLLVSNLEMLKSATFPLSFLSFSVVGAALFEFLIQLMLMIFLLFISETSISLSFFLLPLLLFLLFTVSIGVSWILSVGGYILRDLQEVTAIFFGALLYLTPTMYPVESAPGIMQTLIQINPLTHFVIIFRDCFIPSSDGLHLNSWIFASIISIFVFSIGYATISKTQKFVGDMV